MTDEKIVLTEPTWDRIKDLLDSVPVPSDLENGFDGSTTASTVMEWFKVTDDLDDDDLYTAVPSIYDSETLAWVDQTGAVKIESSFDLIVGQRYLCSAAGSHGVVDNPTVTLGDGDFGTDSDGNPVYDVWIASGSAEVVIVAKITGPGVICDGKTCWAWTEQTPDDSACGTYSDGSRTGTLGCQPTISILTSGDGSSTAMSWSVSFSPALRKGDWKLKLDTTTSTTFNASTTASDIDTAFSPNTSTTGSVSAGFTIADVSDFFTHTLTWAGGSTLIPPPSTPAFEMNGVLDFGYPCLVELKKGGGTAGKLTLAKTSTGDSPTDTIHTVYTVTTNSATQDGDIVFTVDGGTPTSSLHPDISSSDLQTALGGSGVCTVTGSSMGSTYTITFAGYDDHTLTVSSTLIGTLWYRFLAPLTEPTDGTCISRINGVSVTAIPFGDPTHWTGGATPVVLTIDPITGCLVVMPTEACEPFVGGS